LTVPWLSKVNADVNQHWNWISKTFDLGAIS
jgi:hypothetical protein